MADRGERKPRESDKAAQAFADWVALGPGRSLPALAQAYRARTQPVPTRQLSRLKVWSTAHGWQDRLVAAVTAKTGALLAEANELDAETFTITSRLLRERADLLTPLHVDTVLDIRGSVRPKDPKPTPAPVPVSVNHRHTHDHKHEHRHYDHSALSLEEQFALDQMLAKVQAGEAGG